jgi:16S rRNA (guanine966-N2)-methyltransferase
MPDSTRTHAAHGAARPDAYAATVRVVAGEARGRRLTAKVPAGVRPTTDLVREAIFSSLSTRVELRGARVADLYCGSGAMGIEALSRGAMSCTFVDADPACIAAARANLAAVGFADRDATFVTTRLPGWRPANDLELVLCDPPYGEADVTALCKDLTAALVVVETDRSIDPPPHWEVTFERRYGGTLVTMLQRPRDEATS